MGRDSELNYHIFRLLFSCERKREYLWSNCSLRTQDSGVLQALGITPGQSNKLQSQFSFIYKYVFVVDVMSSTLHNPQHSILQKTDLIKKEWIDSNLFCTKLEFSARVCIFRTIRRFSKVCTQIQEYKIYGYVCIAELEIKDPLAQIRNYLLLFTNLNILQILLLFIYQFSITLK